MMLCKVMLVVPSCLEEGWKGMEDVPVAVCWVTAPKGEVAGAPKAGAGALKISSDKIHVRCLREWVENIRCDLTAKCWCWRSKDGSCWGGSAE